MKKSLNITFLAVILAFFLAFIYFFFISKNNIVLNRDFNIVLITIDTLRADHLSCYGYERKTSPNIDKIAEQGIIFKNVIAPSSWTTPSMVSLFTSVYPINHGVINGLGYRRNKTIHMQKVFSNELATLAEILKTQGYTTFGVASNLHLSEKFGFARGFDYFQCLPFLAAPLVNETIYSWEDEIKKSSKYFLWVHYFDPHHPYKTRTPWIERYTSKALTKKLNLSKKSLQKLKRFIPTFKKEPAALSNLVALYDSEINFVDSCVGELIKKYELAKDTFIIITSDHGEEFLEHGQLVHGNNLYQETIHIPLIIKLPYSSKKETVKEYVNLVDIMPTILYLFDIEPPRQTLGKPVMKKRGPLFWIKKVFSHTEMAKYNFAELKLFSDSKTIITTEWKYIYSYEKKTEQLYNLKSDPLELNNLVDKNTKQCKKLKEQLFNWVSSAKQYPTEKLSIQLSPKEKERLEALGYLATQGPSLKKSQEEPKTKVEKRVEKNIKNKLEDSRSVKSEDATLKIVEGSGNIVGINLTNKVPIQGVQFTLEGVKMTALRNTSRTAGFLANFNEESGIVILLSTSGDKIAPGTGLIAEIICDKSSSASLSKIKIGK